MHKKLVESIREGLGLPFNNSKRAYFAKPEGSYFAYPEGSQGGGALFLPIPKVPNSERPYFANPEGSQFGGVLFLANPEKSQFCRHGKTPIRRGPVFCQSGSLIFCQSRGVPIRRGPVLCQSGRVIFCQSGVSCFFLTRKAHIFANSEGPMRRVLFFCQL